MSLTNRAFAVQAAQIAATGANWAADTLAMPEAEQPVRRDQVQRFTATLRDKLDHIDRRAGLPPAIEVPELPLAPFWLVWCDDCRTPPERFATEDEAVRVAIAFANANPGQDFYVLRSTTLSTKAVLTRRLPTDKEGADHG